MMNHYLNTLLLAAFVCFFSSISIAQETSNLDQLLKKADELKLHEDKHFIKLLHYQKGYLSGYRSQIKNESFYFDEKNGVSNPYAELHAMLKMLHQVGTAAAQPPEEENPFCRFPARIKWLRKKLPETETMWKLPACPRFEKYYEALKGDSISLVFSSYFLNNPSSAFGHTFLRINKQPASDGKRYELLDYGINFAANQDTNNPMMYALKGLFGGFKGTFTSIPYYYKVREYNNAESRDLWEYELNVTRETVDMFIAHLWEVGPAEIYYYYLTENCSYFIMTILDAADPSLNFASRMNLYVIPSDTIHLAYSTPGLVKKFNYRPSIRTELQQRLAEMTTEEKAEVLKIVQTRKIESIALPPDSQRKILDAAIDSMDYRYSHQVQIAESAEAKFKNEILRARSKVGLTTPTMKINPPQEEYPHLSHPSRRFNIGPSFSNQGGSYLGIGYKFALHDQLDLAQGYPDYAQITFWDMQFEYSEKRKVLEFERFSMFEVISVTRWDTFDPHYSWRIRVGADRLRSENFRYCHAAATEWGGGLSTDLLTHDFSFYSGVRLSGFYSQTCNGSGFVGAGPELRMRYKFTPKFISLFEAHWRHDIDQRVKNYRELSFGTQYSFSRLNGIRLQAKEKGFEQSVGIEWVNYH